MPFPSAARLFPKMFARTESHLPWQAGGVGKSRGEGAGPPPSDGERREGAAGVAQPSSPGNPRLPGCRGAFRCGPELGLAAADAGPARAQTPQAWRGGAERGRAREARTFPLTSRPARRRLEPGKVTVLRQPWPGSPRCIQESPSTHGSAIGQYVGSMLIALT